MRLFQRARTPRTPLTGAGLPTRRQPFIITLKDLVSIATRINMLLTPLAGAIKVAVMRVTPITPVLPRKSRGGRCARTPRTCALPDAHKGHTWPIPQLRLPRPCERLLTLLMTKPTPLGPTLLPKSLSATTFIQPTACQARITPASKTGHTRVPEASATLLSTALRATPTPLSLCTPRRPTS